MSGRSTKVHTTVSTVFRRAGGNHAKRENNAEATAAKEQLRREAVEALGGPAAVRIFDAFAGSGEMHRRLWKDCAAYAGCDLEPHRDGRRMFAADNRRVMRAIDLGAFNLFDLDAFGSPWEQAIILAERRALAPGEKVGVVWTDGMRAALQMGATMNNALAQLAALQDGTAGMAQGYDQVEDQAVAGWLRRWGARPLRRWRVEAPGGFRMRYGGLIVEAAPR